MSDIHIKDVPVDLHKRLRDFSKEFGVQIQHIILKGADEFMEREREMRRQRKVGR